MWFIVFHYTLIKLLKYRFVLKERNIEVNLRKINELQAVPSEKPQLGEKRKRLSVKMEAGAKCHEAQKKGAE